jgi:hypothetical protein
MDENTLNNIANFICGNDENHPVYRSSSKITDFFGGVGLPQFVHDGSTRQRWVLDRLKECNREELAVVLKRLVSPREYGGNRKIIKSALIQINEILYVEGFKLKLVGMEPVFEKIAVDFSEDGEDVEGLKPLSAPNFLALGLESKVGEILKNRWDEAQRCVDSEAYLSSTIIMGSMLEGLLLGIFQRNPAIANKCPSAPKDTKTGKIKNFANWSLSEMIDVAHQVGWLGLDVKKFSHSLREFRNLIHPYEQMVTGMNPDSDTCGISWLVVQAAVNDIAGQLKNG